LRAELHQNEKSFHTNSSGLSTRFSETSENSL